MIVIVKHKQNTNHIATDYKTYSIVVIVFVISYSLHDAAGLGGWRVVQYFHMLNATTSSQTEANRAGQPNMLRGEH